MKNHENIKPFTQAWFDNRVSGFLMMVEGFVGLFTGFWPAWDLKWMAHCVNRNVKRKEENE